VANPGKLAEFSYQGSSYLGAPLMIVQYSHLLTIHQLFFAIRLQFNYNVPRKIEAQQERYLALF